ncbi:DUF4365 domain-containing protein [Granulicella sp. WH15]|uniref:DUF4365 domain-containing protein n=1 Tax=Granulicella sp. WH15 TaxID=2602070 RepID=UPI00136779A7|nr:DUF4365 domain-containing protein [Granulicella sp. WH15]QHN04776.1 DUF4365 domain-containing protein [Granulicella sp. WH15]
MITRSPEHDTNRAGKRMLREQLEAFGWVVNEITEDYGIDFNVQVFEGTSPTGAWFHVQLKSSESPDYSADGSFISQVLSTAHAHHYMNELQGPIFLVVADAAAKSLFWCAPQLMRSQADAIAVSDNKSMTVRVPTSQALPATAPALLSSLDTLYMLLATRQLVSGSMADFAKTLKHLGGQDVLFQEFQEKANTLKLLKIRDLFRDDKYVEARARVAAILNDLDSSVEIKYAAQVQLEVIDFTDIVRSGRPQAELSQRLLSHAKTLQTITAKGPAHFKFAALIKRKAAELEVLVKENSDVFMTLKQQVALGQNPLMVLNLYARRTMLLRDVTRKYNQCVRLAQLAANYPERWALGRALTDIVKAIAYFIGTLRANGNTEMERQYAESALQICKLAEWISIESGDLDGAVVAILAAVITVHDTDTAGYRWAVEAVQGISDTKLRSDALEGIERGVKRWKGENVPGDYVGDTIWQIIQNVASAQGIDISDEASPLVRQLRIAARDDTFERVLKDCEHLLVSIGAVGPIARYIQEYFATTMAASKVVHCTLHDYHYEDKELDIAYAKFRADYCDKCPDRKPRATDWTYSAAEQRLHEDRHRPLMKSLAGTRYGVRPTVTD